jgi:polyhydroxyalkanoate synthase subunit PhaC
LASLTTAQIWAPPDPRFRHPTWSEVAIFDYIKQSYIITAESVLSTVRGVEGLDKKTARKVNFYTRQFVDAIAPSNFIATNPEVLKATLESGGRNLLNGLANLLRDIDASRRTLSITMSDLDAFRVGETIAATLGKVVCAAHDRKWSDTDSAFDRKIAHGK